MNEFEDIDDRFGGLIAHLYTKLFEAETITNEQERYQRITDCMQVINEVKNERKMVVRLGQNELFDDLHPPSIGASPQMPDPLD